jgi:hypothetical protein
LSSGGGQGTVTSSDAGAATDDANTTASDAGVGGSGASDTVAGGDAGAPTDAGVLLDADSPEVASTDGGPIDQEPTDAGPTDAATVDTTLLDTTAPDTGLACKQGDQGCQGNNIVQCTKGNWLAVQPCAPGTQCTLATDSTGVITAACKVLACGNGVCDAGESSVTCPKDCPPPNPCGNGVCDAGESSVTCPKDCPPPNPCGNGVCGAGESSVTCPKDCPPPNPCGNGVCDAGESSVTCPKDCPPPKPTAGCGSGTDPQFLQVAQTSSGQVQNAYWSIIYQCVTANLGSQGEACTTKVTSCVQGQPSPVALKPSNACASCFATLGCCMAQKCLAECAFDPGSIGCWLCSQNAGCLGAWNACLAAKP